ncbi:unnamed protein product [Moneuplotes crassus]|uniref:Uncharacterized protein n=1 Tax=Euplotes crassus TaxID=5936 RepID=A0AAD2D7P9_EUPCR|nr:unnamed protein product [Moneuplotes crassus]
MKKKKTIAMLKKKNTNSILKVRRNTGVGIRKKQKKSRNEQVYSVHQNNNSFLNSTTNFAQGSKLPEKLTTGLINYKPPKAEKNQILDKRRSMIGKEYCCSFVERAPSPQAIHNLSLVPEDFKNPCKKKKNSTLLFYNSDYSTPQNISNNRLIKKKMSATNFDRYRTFSQSKSRNKVRNGKINQKPVFITKKSRNNMTLDGMNLSSIGSSQIPQSNSMLLKKICKNTKIKGLHYKFNSETPKRKRKNLDSDLVSIQQSRKDTKSIEKKPLGSKDKLIVNIIKDNIEKSLNNKIKILEKDLKKKQIEFTIRNQQYSENLSKMHERSDHEKLKLNIYEMLNNPRYEFDLEEVKNLKSRHSMVQEEFQKCLTLVQDDNLRCLMNLMKSNYDTQIKDIIANAERNLKTIKTMKTKLDGPINDVLDQINTLQFQFTTENKKNQFEIDEQRQKIDQLNQEIKKLRCNGGVDLDEIDRNEKRLLKELKVVNKENKQMKEVIQEFKDEVDYCKQRENKLMYFLYVMKEKGLPVGEIFEEEIKEIPTKRFSKYFDDESRDEREKEETRKLMSLSERIFPVSREQVISDTTSIMNITDGPPMKQKRFSIVPELRLDGLPPRHIHYFSDDSERSGYDLSIERRKFNENATVSQKYNLASYGKRMKQEKLHRKASEDSFQKSKILQLGSKLFASDSL